MDYFLGFDGGGTKTECVLMNEAGKVLASARSGASNPVRGGYPQTWRSLRRAADVALSRKKIKARAICGVCAGLAGASQEQVVRRVRAFLRKLFPKARVRVTTDLEIALRGAFGETAGVVLIGGTGSAAFGRNASGETARAGGRGPWFGDEGSAYDIGRKAVAAVARAEDGLAQATSLAELILPAVRCRYWNDFATRVAKAPDAVFGEIFPVVLVAAGAGDAVAQEILRSAAISLAEIVESVVRKLGLGGEPFALVKTGGIFGRSPLFDQAVDERLAAISPKLRIRQMRVSPAEAAAEMARSRRDRSVHVA